ncbi:MAG: glycosyltransferase WbuB [Planctomycetota bacterium]|nr:MAG: glycosyltransferase WbuB [Planctomycetota bacterium]
MKILFVTHFFQPEPNFFYGLPFAKKLVELGHKVEVLTGFPNYPAGKIYDGYKVKFLQREVMDGIPVNRVPLYPSHDQSSLKRIANYSSFAFTASTIGAAIVKSADVAFIGQGPTTIGLPGIILKYLRRIPYVYYIQDLWPDCLDATGMFTNKAGIWMTSKWCGLTYKCASKIAVISPGYKQKLIERGVPESKIEVIYNWCNDDVISTKKKDDQLADSMGMTGKLNVVFAGNMGKAQALENVLEAAAILKSRQPHVQFVMIGGGVEVDNLKQKAGEMDLDNMRFFPRKPISEIGAILSLADILLVHLRADPVYDYTIPSKTQAYLSVGRPILIGVKGDAADLVTRAKAGLVCEPENPQSIVEKVEEFCAMPKSQLDQMGNNGREFYNKELSFAVGTKRFLELFEAVAKKPRKPGN